MDLPTIIVNFKVYQQATGIRAIELARVHQKVATETGASIGIAVSALDLEKVCQEVNIPVFAQHIDPLTFGSNTGSIIPKMVKEVGAFGTLLNHAEKKLEHEVLEKSVEAAQAADLFTIVCADTPQQAAHVKSCNPNLIAMEPPELIGGDVSISKAGPELIEQSFEIVGEGKLLVGAGVNDKEDIEIALSKGAVGVLLASAVTKAQDPESVLRELCEGLK